MTIANVVPTIWSARLLDTFERTAVYADMLTDVSAEVASDGNKVELGRITTDPTIGDYTKGTDITFQTLADAKTTLSIDQEKYWALSLDDIDAAQAKPALMEPAVGKAARKLARVFDDYVAGVLAPSSVAAANKTAMGSTAFGASSADDLGDVTDAQAKAFVLKINEVLATKIQQANWDAEVRGTISTDAAGIIRQHLIATGAGSDGLQDSVLLEGQLSRFLGIRLRIDTNMASGVLRTAGTPLLRIFASDAAYWAAQINRVEFGRHEKQFGDFAKGLMVYGAVKSPYGEKLHVIEV
ncbi:MAG: hypothetical protein F4Y92_01960 [Dehalococcoidia bacterium]|nr:hypothetical protein [Dehalococcoidia bacterium]